MFTQQLPIVVFCHLRWNFVYQRPQHILSRLAETRRVLYIEEPVCDVGRAGVWETQSPRPNLTVCRPYTAVQQPGFNDEQHAALKPMIANLLNQCGIDACVAWFYTPMALPLGEVLDARATIYDCMDELSAFNFAPPQLLERESELLKQASVVFTGGPSLYKSKRDRHPNVHCFSSSVDAKHFAQAKTVGAIPEAADQAGIAGTKLGFFGVIDERFDVPLLNALSIAHPEWQFCIVGPVVKIDPASLPHRDNIHYFGQRTYQELPGFLVGWDACLLLFALNASTKFISPTKTLEYMAAERPIISTPITDVVEPYGDVVYIGDSHESFIAACERALSATAAERAERIQKMRAVLAKTSWEKTAASMSELIEEAVARPTSAPISMDIPPVIVIGGGPTGLSAAYQLGENALLLEQNSGVGGWCRSIQEKGYTFDFAGHIMFSNDPFVHDMYAKLLGDNVHWQNREAWIYSKEVYTRYPFQGALYGLPPDVIKECIVGAIESRFGTVKKAATPPSLPASNGHANGSNVANGNGNANGNGATNGNGNGTGNGNGNGHGSHVVHPPVTIAGALLVNGNGGPSRARALAQIIEERRAQPVQDVSGRISSSPSSCKAESITDCCADGIAESAVALGEPRPLSLTDEPRNFEEFIYKVWGRGIAKHFAIPYNKKLWAVPLTEMETSWLGGRVPMPDLEEMIEGALHPVARPMGPNARFGYPLRGGFQALMNGFLPLLKNEPRLNTRITAVSPSRRTITTSDGATIPYEYLISTMPLPVLIRCMGDEAPPEVQAAAKGLRHVSVRCVNIGVRREKLTDKHWIYYPEDSIFHRIFVQGNASPHCNAPGGFGITCEITYSEYKPLPCDGQALIERCIADCHKVGIFNADDVIDVANQVDMPHAYVVYDHARPKNVALIRDWLAKQDIVLAGRYSEWEYYNSDHAFIAGKKAADRVKQLQEARQTVLV